MSVEVYNFFAGCVVFLCLLAVYILGVLTANYINNKNNSDAKVIRELIEEKKKNKDKKK